MVKSLDFFFKTATSAFLCEFFFCFDQTLLNLARMFAAHQRFSKVSVNHLFDNPDSEKKFLLEKSLERVLYFEFKILYEP